MNRELEEYMVFAMWRPSGRKRWTQIGINAHGYKLEKREEEWINFKTSAVEWRLCREPSSPSGYVGRPIERVVREGYNGE